MNRLFRISASLTNVLSFLGMVGVMAMMIHICADVIARTLFDISVPATLELVTRYYMLMLVLLPLAWVERNRCMIVVEVFSGAFGDAVIRLIDAIVALACSIVYIILAISTWQQAVGKYDVGAYIVALDTQIILWPGYFVLPISFALAGVVCLIRIPHLYSSSSAIEPE